MPEARTETATQIEDEFARKLSARQRVLAKKLDDRDKELSRWRDWRWQMRHRITSAEALARSGVGRLTIVDNDVVWFGHIGDGNVHLNVLKPDDLPMEEFQRRCGEVSRWVFEIVKRHGVVRVICENKRHKQRQG